MRITLSSLVVAATLLAGSLGVSRVAHAAAPPSPDGDAIERAYEPVPDQYIVTLRPGSDVGERADTLAAEHDGTVVQTYRAALDGFAVRMSDADAQALRRDPAVAAIEQDAYVRALAAPVPWGIDRIDQRNLPPDGSYVYGADGRGVTAYIIDTGVRTSHEEFAGRASVGFDAVRDGYNGQDCNGHGTHVAGIVGATSYGVAKNVSLVSVRVLDCTGVGTLSQVISGVDWVTAHHASPAVANMSVGGPTSSALDNAVQTSIASGVPYAIAAGNDGADACGASPARAANALTVAATTSTDSRASFSNFGPCVDLFAPGVSITSTSNGSDSASRSLSGTSMAAPHVAGSAAMYLQAHPTASPADVNAALVDQATRDHVSNPGVGSPNRLDFVGFISAPSDVSVTRIWGQDAIGTALAISQAQYPTFASAQTVVLARSDHFADALAGGPLAATRAGPLLITPGAALSATIDPRVLSEIQRVLPTRLTVYILGGPLALAPGIDDVLRGLGYQVVRVQGANQFATAVAIANALGNPSTVFEATGLHYADALSSVPAAIRTRGAILLTNGAVQAPETAAYLQAHPPTTRYAVGGPLAAAGADPNATPVYGQDLFATSAAVANVFFPAARNVGGATGLDFPDALAGGVFMGAAPRVGPVVLLDPALPIPPTISAYLAQNGLVVNDYLFGGALAIGDDVAVEFARLSSP